MKKWLSILTVLLVSSVAQAAIVQWNAMAIRDNGTALNGVTAYLYVVEAGADMSATWASIASGTDATLLPGFTDSAVTSQTGNIPGREIANMENQNGFLPSTTYEAYLVVIDEGRFAYTDGRSFTTPAWIETNEQDSNILFGFVNFSDEDWQQISGDTPIDPDVPEPTALALLALGVAGVALRRRVA